MRCPSKTTRILRDCLTRRSARARLIANARLAALTAALALATSGCAWLTGYDAGGQLAPKLFTVDLSSLDWIEISYFPRDNDPVFALPCRLNLMGSGEIIFQTGRSPRLWDSFSEKVQDPYWDELFTDRMHLERADMQALYQELVDAGLYPLRPSRVRQQEISKPFARVNGKIHRERVLRIVSERRLIRIIERTLDSFEETARMAQRATRRQ